MEREQNDVNVSEMSSDQINEMEELRVQRLQEANIDELDVLGKAKEHLNVWTSFFQENITRGKDDVNFCIRDQWTAVERSEFTRLFKPCMMFNKMHDSVKKVIAEQRKNKPNLMARPLNGRATQEQINLRSDLIRTISYHSQNDLVYQTAFRSALTMSFGAFQIFLNYKTPRSFEKTIEYGLITDPTLCSWDPTSVKPHKGDGNFCSRRYIFSRDEFFATYPYVLNPVSFADPYTILDFQWVTKDTIVVCDYFVKEWFPLVIYKLSNGMSVDQNEWEEAQETYKKQKELVEGSIVSKILENGMPKVVDQRQTQDYKIMHYRMLKDQIIDFSEWPSKQLPIIFVDGDSYYIEGRQYTKSFIREGRDAQKLLNYSRSELAAELKNRRREQWIATPDNIIGYEQQWRNPELQMGALMAKPDPKTGQMPQKMPAWDINQGIFATSQAATQDLREILGFSESEEMQGRDISGKARRERKIEGSMAAYVFFDNLNQAIAQGGRVVNDLLPYVIGDEERFMVLSKQDGKTDDVILNQQMLDGTVKNKLDDGEYNVEIDAGPSFAVQKEMALEFMQQTLQANPQSFPLIADLWAKNLDVQFMPQIAERFKTMVPPQILAKEEGKQLPPQPPSPQEQMMKAEIQLKQAQIQERAHELAIRQKKHELEEAQLILDAKKAENDMAMQKQNHHVDMMKADMDFSSKIAKILADTHNAQHKNAQ